MILQSERPFLLLEIRTFMHNNTNKGNIVKIKQYSNRSSIQLFQILNLTSFINKQRMVIYFLDKVCQQDRAWQNEKWNKSGLWIVLSSFWTNPELKQGTFIHIYTKSAVWLSSETAYPCTYRLYNISKCRDLFYFGGNDFDIKVLSVNDRSKSLNVKERGREKNKQKPAMGAYHFFF
jgi:hypothetical protein